MDDSFAFFKFRKNNDINNTTINDNKNNNTIIMTTQEGQFEANGNGKKKEDLCSRKLLRCWGGNKRYWGHQQQSQGGWKTTLGVLVQTLPWISFKKRKKKRKEKSKQTQDMEPQGP